MKKDWTYKKLGEVCCSKKQVQRASKISLSEYIHYIDISSINNKTNTIDQPTEMIFSEAPSRAQQIVQKNDILVSCVRPNLKNIAIVKDDIDNLVASSGFCVLRTKDIDYRYLYHIVKSDFFTNYLCSKVSGANYPAVREDDIKGAIIPIPPLCDQELIVRELDAIHGILDKKQAQLRELDHLAQAIFYDMFGDPITNPKQWEVSCFKQIMTPAKSKKYGKGEGLPILSITMRNGIIFQEDRFKKRIASVDVSGYKVVKKGQLVIAFPIDEGLIYIQNIASEGIMSPAYNVWDVDYEKVCVDYITKYLHSDFCMSYYKDKLRGTTLRRRMIPKDDLLNLPIPLPPLSLQQSFAAKIEAIEAQKTAIRQSIREVEALLAERMDAYFA